MTSRLTKFTAATVFIFSISANAQVTQPDGAVTTPEANPAKSAPQAVPPTPAPTPSIEKTLAALSSITPFGDVRYRFEQAHNEAPAAGKKGTYDHARLRARVGVKAKPTDDLAIEFRLATGAGGTGTNATFGESTKGMRNFAFTLDRASFKYTPVSYGSFTGGRMANPMILVGDNDLLFDADLNFDGLVLGGDHKFGSFATSLRAGDFTLDESKDAASGNDVKFTALQGAVRFAATEKLSVALTVAQYSFVGVKGHASILGGTDFGSNSNDGTNYSSDFSILSGGLDVTYDFVTLFGEYAKNASASTNSVAYIYGLKLGKLKDAGDFAFGIDQRVLETDSAFGILTDGDSFGGGTNGRSVRGSLGYNITKAFGIQVAAYVGQKNIATGETAVGRDRYHVDLNFKF